MKDGPETPYIPAAHLISGPLDAPQVISLFEDFRSNLRHVSTAPELVFERIVANLCDAFKAVMENERQQHSRDRDASRLSNKKLQAEITDLKVAMENERQQHLRDRDASRLSDERLHDDITDLKAVMERERQQHSRDSDASRLSNERLQADITDLKVAMENEREQHSLDRDASRLSNERLHAEITDLERHISEHVLSNLKDTSKHPPPTSPPVVEIQPRPNPFIGAFTTDEIRYWFQLRAQTSKLITFGRPYRAPPGLPVGLTSVHMSKLTPVRIKAHATQIRDDRFEIHLDSWANTILFNAGCTWLEIEADDPDFQFGTYSTLENRIADEAQQLNSREVLFARPYASPPCVVVWLSGFDIRSDNYWRIKTYATAITAAGFSIHIDTWDDTVLCSGTATWVAYTAGKPGVCSGSFSTGSNGPKRSHTGYEAFEKGLFETCPRVVVALDKMDVSCSRFLRLRVRTAELSVEGVRWNLEGWVDTDVNAAGASYIALRWA